MALKQKILALALRTQTQARDVFDINLLLQQGTKISPSEVTSTELYDAIHNAHGITFSDFKAQVVSYLENEYIKQYSDPDLWDNILIKVIDYMSELNETNKHI